MSVKFKRNLKRD